ncbi:MAG TPA: ParB N-terminal domain-containing protein [Bosea sp. (in: a-proteobacteria)]|jgi:ParB/RepB/Spo0J family partition protein|uniref:ParB N-terminal domain-containing protein n=1 Tax=Bosea sp. (in: a-proteobacteria) TaxID=1871050 RepID=UPI002DDCF43F|nr:ParB N-terminal domain-containing protein [Bosea sp. (in: a-proteobacteria)]HEV2555174.1 ParB N-terminal domain-containing protein [Bosea sp. (in: a-proteobacteria)]
MHLMKVDPRALKENSDRSRQTKSTPQADALLLATIKAVGLVQPPVIAPQTDGGNGYIIDSGHRRVKQAIAAGLEEIDVLVVDAANDNGAMRSMVENIAREPLNPVDQWRAIERLVALGWTEEAIGIALALPVRQIKKLRLLANVLPAMLDHMAKGDMPNEQQLRAIAAANLDEQRDIWKAQKPKKGDPQVSWWSVANALSKKCMYARDASFGDDLAQAYGISWVEDLFAPADEDSRYTTNVERFLGAQQEWMTIHLPKRGVITDVNNYGQVVLPPKAERVYGKPGKSDRTAMYLDREGKVQSVNFRLPEPKKSKGADDAEGEDAIVMPKPRPDVTRKGVEMIGDLRTDALHEALARAPIEDDTLMALLVLALAGRNISVQSGASDDVYGFARMARHAVQLVDGDGKVAFDRDTLRVAARSALIDVLSARENRTKSGIVARLAGDAIGADGFLPTMGTDEFLSCLSRQALERSCKDTPVLPRARVKDTRAALVEHFKEQRFVHPSAAFAPTAAEVASWRSKSVVGADEDADVTAGDADIGSGDVAALDNIDLDAVDEAYRVAAE